MRKQTRFTAIFTVICLSLLVPQSCRAATYEPVAIVGDNIVYKMQTYYPNTGWEDGPYARYEISLIKDEGTKTTVYATLHICTNLSAEGKPEIWTKYQENVVVGKLAEIPTVFDSELEYPILINQKIKVESYQDEILTQYKAIRCPSGCNAEFKSISNGYGLEMTREGGKETIKFATTGVMLDYYAEGALPNDGGLAKLAFQIMPEESTVKGADQDPDDPKSGEINGYPVAWLAGVVVFGVILGYRRRQNR
jgi:hypothetical protein